MTRLPLQIRSEQATGNRLYILFYEFTSGFMYFRCLQVLASPEVTVIVMFLLWVVGVGMARSSVLAVGRV